MTDSISAGLASSQAGPSRSASRHGIEGLGKFKLSSSAPKGSTYKTKFHSLRERYDVVTSKQEDLRRELELANQRLKAVQAENDLLLDAMQIVTPTQPGLLSILQQIDPDPAMLQLNGPPDHLGPGPPPPLPPPGVGADVPNGNGNMNGHAHHVHPAGLNGHAHTRRYEDSGDHDEAMQDDEMLIDRDYPAPAVNGR
ncbi:hypothetical protein M0805_003973 [Coniferiporia weirii]|nr:hypothetical protein M0805_003973 [Coniferiporia weirii]